ncbi:MAG: serine/threonine-protein kinase [Acidobacteria bacterium]|nr:serine/threonine-protein kinase [Acidobacteriota bacterium]
MPLAAGTCLGPYEIAGLLGAGGMGEVYRAKDTRPGLGREVAVKVLPAAFSKDPDRLRRFEQETRAAGALNHPNILTIYDVGTHDGGPYLVSELLEGETLRERLRGPALPLNKVLDYAAQTASGLAAAHEKGIVHRDLKPENLFITRGGRMKILDFGLAKLTQPDPAQDQANLSTETAWTEEGAILGTVGYMSPEQAGARPADFRADQFSFGVILYEMVTGKRAFARDTAAQTLSAIITQDPEPISTLHPQTPAPFRWLIERCLAKDPKERYGSTSDLGRDLGNIGKHLAELRTPESRPAAEAVAQPHGSRRVVLAAGVGAAALAGAVALGWWIHNSRTPAAPPTLQTLTFSGRDWHPAASPDGRLIAFVSDRDSRDLRTRVWLKDLVSGNEVAIASSGPDNFPRFSPDSASILFTRREGSDFSLLSLYRVATVGGEPRKLVGDVAFGGGDWSPDGRQIVFVRGKTKGGKVSSAISIVGANGEGEREIAGFDYVTLMCPRWSPDGRTIAASELPGLGNKPSIFLISANGEERRSVETAHGGNISCVAWTGADQVVYSQVESTHIFGGGVGSGIVRQNLKSGSFDTVFRSAQSADVLDVLSAGRIVFGAESGGHNLRELVLSRAGPPEYRWLTRGGSQDWQPVYSPDGEWVMFSSNRAGNLDLWAISTKGGALRRITDDPKDDLDPAFSADARKILWSSNRSGAYEVWMSEADGSAARRVSNDGNARNPVATPDLGWIIYWTTNPAKQGLWKIRPDGTQATRLAAGKVTEIEISPDGQYAAYAEQAVVRVVRIADGATVPFEINGASRHRWMPGPQGAPRAIAFVARDEKGVLGVYVQDFIPERNTSKTRRPLGGFDREFPTETFAISPDGSRMVVSSRDDQSSVMLAENIPGISPPRRGR